MSPESHSESPPDNHPPAPVINGVGRITNLDDILANIERYSDAELVSICTSLNSALGVLNETLKQYNASAMKHLGDVKRIRGEVNKTLQTVGEGRMAEIGSPEDILGTNEMNGEEVMNEGMFTRLSGDDTFNYAEILVNIVEVINKRLS